MHRSTRYGAPIVLIVLGIGFAAIDTGAVGNTVVSVCIAVGLIWLIAVVGRDAGMTERRGRRERPDRPEGAGRSDRPEAAATTPGPGPAPEPAPELSSARALAARRRREHAERRL